MQDDDLRLLRDCLAGKQGAWEAFLERFRPYLAEVARDWLGHAGRPSGPQEVDDLLQEILLCLLEDGLKALRAYRGRGSFKGYLAAVAAYRALRQPAPGIPLEDVLLPAVDPREGEAAAEKKAGFRHELARLPARDRLALALQADGAPLREIGAALGISEGAAAQVLSRARAALRERLKES